MNDKNYNTDFVEIYSGYGNKRVIYKKWIAAVSYNVAVSEANGNGDIPRGCHVLRASFEFDLVGREYPLIAEIKGPVALGSSLDILNFRNTVNTVCKETVRQMMDIEECFVNQLFSELLQPACGKYLVGAPW